MSRKIGKLKNARATASRMPARRDVSAKTAASTQAALKQAALKKANSPFKVTTYVWRRLHDGNIIAQASPLAGMGSWRVSAYRTTDDAEPAYEPRSFALLRDAHHSADELVERHFAHTCRTGVCGRWLRWPDE